MVRVTPSPEQNAAAPKRSFMAARHLLPSARSSSLDNAQTSPTEGVKSAEVSRLSKRQRTGSLCSLRSSFVFHDWQAKDEAELHSWDLSFKDDDPWVEYYFRRLRERAAFRGLRYALIFSALAMLKEPALSLFLFLLSGEEYVCLTCPRLFFSRFLLFFISFCRLLFAISISFSPFP